MNYQPKVIRCRLKTGGKTIQEIREKNKGQGMVYRDFENIKKTYDILTAWFYFFPFGTTTSTQAIICIIGTRRTTNA